ncbi:hypothetical protein CITRIK5_70149 [Citricoccus sp. K5]|nr:hypothetical protein CITRIK5_70149 [Citricoccus sp. K5]
MLILSVLPWNFGYGCVRAYCIYNSVSRSSVKIPVTLL